MTTRASLARGQVKEQFEGRVRKWVREKKPIGKTGPPGYQVPHKLELMRWLQTGAWARGVAAGVKPGWHGGGGRRGAWPCESTGWRTRSVSSSGCGWR